MHKHYRDNIPDDAECIVYRNNGMWAGYVHVKKNEWNRVTKRYSFKDEAMAAMERREARRTKPREIHYVKVWN